MLEFWNSTLPIARKEYICSLCGEKIHIGEKYHRYLGKYDGDMFDNKYHLTCQNILDAYYNETGEREFSNDDIEYWLHDKYCLNCEHSDTCDKFETSCSLISKNYDNIEERANEDNS